MDRQPPRTTTDEIDLYIRTYSSLLRSSGEVRVRAFEEAHLYSSSSLHLGARDPRPDAAAFAYSAARLPGCIDRTRLVVMGQAHEQFEAAGFAVRPWQEVRTRGRRRGGTCAAGSR
jgi:transcription initiation factor TFIIIB Brf1 subunit/transcription initiation factor TFIIB